MKVRCRLFIRDGFFFAAARLCGEFLFLGVELKFL
jgi:hypothetical protein